MIVILNIIYKFQSKDSQKESSLYKTINETIILDKEVFYLTQNI